MEGKRRLLLLFMFTLEASLNEESIRVFRSLLICLRQFGNDLFFEANEHFMTLRMLNAAQSAFIVFTLPPTFFATYTVCGFMSYCLARHEIAFALGRWVPAPGRLSNFT